MGSKQERKSQKMKSPQMSKEMGWRELKKEGREIKQNGGRKRAMKKMYQKREKQRKIKTCYSHVSIYLIYMYM